MTENLKIRVDGLQLWAIDVAAGVLMVLFVIAAVSLCAAIVL